RCLLGGTRLVVGRQTGLDRATSASTRHRSAVPYSGPGVGASRGGGGGVLGGCGRALPDGIRRQPACVHRPVRARRYFPDPWTRRSRSRLYRAATAQGFDARPAAPAAGPLDLRVAYNDPRTTSARPMTAPTVKGSCSTGTPR